MNPVAQGLALGYSAQKLIGFLSKAFPSLAPRIKQAQRNGHSVEQVLGFLSKTMETDLPKGTSQQEVLAATNKNKEQLTKHGLTLAASAVAAPLAATAARSVLARALPHALAPQAASLANASNIPNPNALAPQPTSPLPTAINPISQPQQNTSPQPPISPNVPNTPQAAQQPPLSNANAASIPEPTNIQQPEVISNPKEYLEKAGLLPDVDRMLKEKNTPEAIAAVLGIKQTKGKAQAKIDPELLRNIEEYAKTAPIQEQPQLQETEQLQEPIEQPKEQEKINKNKLEYSDDIYDSYGGEKFGEYVAKHNGNPVGVIEYSLQGDKVHLKNIEVKEDLKRQGIGTNLLDKFKKDVVGKNKLILSDKTDEGSGFFKSYDKNSKSEAPKIEKNSVVSSPNGVGEVKEIRNGQAIVEVDGKLHKVKEEELQPEPEEVKKAKIEFNLDDVDESLRSAPLNEVYAPAHRKHVTIKYNSDVGKDKSKRYIFFKKDGSPVDEDIIQKLREGSQLPVSSGKTFWGGWSADTQDSRGTVAYHELSKLAQKEGEEDDPSKPYWFEEEEEIFTHGYSKQSEKELIKEKKKFDEEEKRLNAEKKKLKKKRA